MRLWLVFMWQKPGEMSPSEPQFFICKVEMAALHNEIIAGLYSEGHNVPRFCIGGRGRRGAEGGVYGISLPASVLSSSGIWPTQVERCLDYSNKRHKIFSMLFSYKAKFILHKLHYPQLSDGFS